MFFVLLIFIVHPLIHFFIHFFIFFFYNRLERIPRTKPFVLLLRLLYCQLCTSSQSEHSIEIEGEKKKKNTVEPLINDPPRKGLSPKIGHLSRPL